MILECFEEYYRSQHEKIGKNYFLAVKYHNEDGIHDMRVEIKRLRAFFRLIEGINPNFQAKPNLKKIQKLFKAAGTVRDIHVQLELVRKWMTKPDLELSEYYNFLKQKEVEVRQTFSASNKKFDFGIFDKNWTIICGYLTVLPPDYIKFKIKQRMKNALMDLIKDKNKESFVEQEYHDIRIKSKETRYTLEIYQKCIPYRQPLNLLNDALRSLHQTLGRWHDDDVGLQFLRGFQEEFSDQTFFSPDSYLMLTDRLTKEKTDLLNEFEKRWRKFLNLLKTHTFFRVSLKAAPQKK